MKWGLLFILLFGLLVLTGCTGETVDIDDIIPDEKIDIPNPDDNPEAFECNIDEDCGMQQTACNNCGCSIAINKNFVQSLNCDYNDTIICTLKCTPFIPRCFNNMCKEYFY
jgi:hypothetical protein